MKRQLIDAGTQVYCPENEIQLNVEFHLQQRLFGYESKTLAASKSIDCNMVWQYTKIVELQKLLINFMHFIVHQRFSPTNRWATTKYNMQFSMNTKVVQSCLVIIQSRGKAQSPSGQNDAMEGRLPAQNEIRKFVQFRANGKSIKKTFNQKSCSVSTLRND